MKKIYKRSFKRNDNRELLLYGYKEHNETPAKELEAVDPSKPHMRWNPSRQEWVTYSPTRKNRTAFPPKEYCPLCPGAELDFPTEIPFKNFEVAIFPNRWASFNTHNDNLYINELETKNSNGQCEVVVYSAKHLDTIAQMSLNRVELLLNAWIDRYKALLDKDEINEGVCLVDIGGGTTDVAIFLDGIIRHTAVIPFGGNVITKDIKSGIQILEKQAEMLKIKFGSAMSSSTKENVIVSIPGLRGKNPKEVSVKNLSSIIEARMKEIIELVNHQIQSSGYQDSLMTGIVITGGGSQLRNLHQLVSYITGKEVRIGLPNEYLGSDSKMIIKSPIYSTGVGLVQKGFEEVDWNEVQDNWPPEKIPTEEEPPTVGIGGKLKQILENWFSDDIN